MDNLWIRHTEVWGSGGGTQGQNCIGLFADGYGCYAMYYSGKGMLIEDNIFRHNAGWGIQQYKSGCDVTAGCDPEIFYDKSDSIVRNNLVYGNGFYDDNLGYGIAIGSGRRNKAYNNVVVGNAAGISLYLCEGCEAYNNTVIGNVDTTHSGGGAGITIGEGAGSLYFTRNNTVRNNILSGNTGNRNIDNTQDPNFTADTNLCNVDGLGCDSVGDPQVVNPATPTCPVSTRANPIPVTPDRIKTCAAGFFLQGGSLARDTGATLSGFNTDMFGPRGGKVPAGTEVLLSMPMGAGVQPNGNPIYVSGGGHGDTPSDGAGDVQSCITAENIATPKATLAGACVCMATLGKSCAFGAASIRRWIQARAQSWGGGLGNGHTPHGIPK